MTVQGGSNAGTSPTVQSYTFKQFFALPDPAVISSRQLDVTGRRCATWAVAEKTPDVRNGDLVSKYGQKFIWSPLHKTLKELEPMREIGDPDCDAVLQVLDPTPDHDILQMLLDKADAAALPSAGPVLHEKDAENEKVLLDFLAKYSSVPSWVNWEKIQRGQQVFTQYMPLCGLTLFYLSLVGGFSAPLITKVLRATGYLTSGSKRVMKRLMDTGHMICECVVDGSLRPETRGEGWKAVMRVRFLHGMVRRRLHDKPYWRANMWGVPINQEDMAATLLAFSYNVIVGTEMILGHPLSAEDQEAYTHLWRYIGWLIGVDEHANPCMDVSHAKATLESIVMHLLEPDEDSRAVAHHLLRAPARGQWGLRFRFELCRRFLGHELADALALPRHAAMRHVVTAFIYALRAYGWLAEGACGSLLQRLLHRMHMWTLVQALDRGQRMGSTHHLKADLPADFSADYLTQDGRKLSSDSLPSPAALSACPFRSLASAFPNPADPISRVGSGAKETSGEEELMLVDRSLRLVHMVLAASVVGFGVAVAALARTTFFISR